MPRASLRKGRGSLECLETLTLAASGFSEEVSAFIGSVLGASGICLERVLELVFAMLKPFDAAFNRRMGAEEALNSTFL